MPLVLSLNPDGKEAAQPGAGPVASQEQALRLSVLMSAPSQAQPREALDSISGC